MRDKKEQVATHFSPSYLQFGSTFLTQIWILNRSTSSHCSNKVSFGSYVASEEEEKRGNREIDEEKQTRDDNLEKLLEICQECRSS